ncbi:hypothetical protein [Bradyrhizobium sp. 187]|uniref:hypothetical protein n=1 Tax=Bradyrhizobium sp. 187 TaxID=2782655 RepID=UPI001FFE3486|nr:hypothetical protein [Bradyrhizobium sp. 187]UPJ76156.1 hypothetical protein IVB19_17350 [Bradyrhizobium sp. 187]
MLVMLLSKRFGSSGFSCGGASLQAGQGSPATPQPQAFGPSQGRSGWFSQASGGRHSGRMQTSGPPSVRRGLLLDLLPVQMVEHIAEVAHVQHLPQIVCSG